MGDLPKAMAAKRLCAHLALVSALLVGCHVVHASDELVVSESEQEFADHLANLKKTSFVDTSMDARILHPSLCTRPRGGKRLHLSMVTMATLASVRKHRSQSCM